MKEYYRLILHTFKSFLINLLLLFLFIQINYSQGWEWAQEALRPAVELAENGYQGQDSQQHDDARYQPDFGPLELAVDRTPVHHETGQLIAGVQRLVH